MSFHYPPRWYRPTTSAVVTSEMWKLTYSIFAEQNRYRNWPRDCTVTSIYTIMMHGAYSNKAEVFDWLKENNIPYTSVDCVDSNIFKLYDDESLVLFKLRWSE